MDDQEDRDTAMRQADADAAHEEFMIDEAVTAERERCALCLEAFADDARRFGMEKVPDLLDNIGEALRLGLSADETIATLTDMARATSPRSVT